MRAAAHATLPEERTVSGRTLPFNEDPPIRNQLYNAYPLSILSVHDAYLPWLHSNFVQVCVRIGRGFPFTQVDFYRPPHFPSVPLLRTQTLDRSLFEDLFRIGVVRFLAEVIEDGNYVQLIFDESYLYGPERQGYFPHPVMVHGYHPDTETFDICGYFGPLYRSAAVPYALMERAFCSEDLQQEIASGRRHVLGRLSSLWLAKYDPMGVCQFDKVLLLEQIEDYLASRNTSERYRALHTQYFEHESSGMATYESVRRRLEHMKVDEYYDVRSLHAIWEHKKCMVRRIEFMEEEEHLPRGTTLLERYRELEREAEVLRVKMMRYEQKRSPEKVDQLVEGLLALAGREREVMRELADRLGG